MSGVALSAALSAASGVGASPPVLTRGRPIASAPQLTYLIKNGLVVPGLTRAQPGGALAAAFSAPGVITTYAADVPRFPFGGNRMLISAVPATNMVLNSAVLSAPLDLTVSPAPSDYYYFSFYGTGTLRVSTPQSSIFDYQEGGENALFHDYVGRGANAEMAGGVKPSGSVVTLTPTGDVRFVSFYKTIAERYNPLNRFAAYIPTTGAPATNGADVLGNLSFPALFPNAEGTVVVSWETPYCFNNEQFSLFSTANAAQNKFFGMSAAFDGSRLIYTCGASGAGAVFVQLTGTPWPASDVRLTLGATFTRAGRLAAKQFGKALAVTTGAMDLMGSDTAHIGPPASDIFGNSKLRGALMVGVLPYAANDADLTTFVDLMHSAP